MIPAIQTSAHRMMKIFPGLIYIFILFSTDTNMQWRQTQESTPARNKDSIQLMRLRKEEEW